ncbi:nucleotidyltransferase family protein [uncultured Pontibacter sp.]|uniref:nucleotidyltransferase family protein n=1 Tax=uncultured Pontibacter sp. TaxID=453356 RepID=UPI0026328FF8|nr:nucleotidyltransferase family protein [uncultured Pontibacter sp.]
METGLIILAAGASTRLGRAKQQLVYKGQNLLQRAVQEGYASACTPVVVVLGARAAQLELDLPAAPVLHTTENPDWQQGMASSVKAGLQKMLAVAPAVGGIILMVCDQPFADRHILNNLINTLQSSEKKIAACAYSETLGTPVMFSKPLFQELLQLQGQEGAKKLLFKYAHDVAAVPFAKGSIDIDTAADYAALRLSE